MVTEAQRMYKKQYYQDNKERENRYHKRYMAERTPYSKKHDVTLTETNCIGPLCWPKGLTFMSPDPARVRRCDRCVEYTGGR